MKATDENKAYNKLPVHAMPDIRAEISGECLGSIGEHSLGHSPTAVTGKVRRKLPKTIPNLEQ